MSKVLMFTHLPIPDIRVDKEAITLTENGHEVYIICSRQGKGDLPKVYKKVYFVPLRRVQKAFIPFSLRKVKRKYKKISDEVQPDIYHAHDLVAANIAFRIKPKNVKFVYDDHEIWDLIKKLEWRERKGFFKKPIRFYQYLAARYLSKKVMRKADLIIVVQEHWIDYYNKKGINRNKIISIENYTSKEIIDTALKREDLVDSFILNDPRKKIVHSSKISKASEDYLRNINNFVEAISDLEDWVMIIIGPEDESYSKQGVKFLPPMQIIQYLACVARCDVALNPLALNERLQYCSPNRLYENAALGIRIISTKAKVFYEKFNDLLIWADENTSKNEIKNILENINEYPSGQEIKEYAKRFNWEDSVKILITKYDEILT